MDSEEDDPRADVGHVGKFEFMRPVSLIVHIKYDCVIDMILFSLQFGIFFSFPIIKSHCYNKGESLCVRLLLLRFAGT